MHKNGYLSMPITKGLPYGLFMKQIIIEIIDDGQLDKLQNKWKALPPICDSSQNGKSLGWEKLISIFIITLIGIFNAIMILFIEKIFHACAPKRHVSIMEANHKKLEAFFKKFLNNLKKDEDFLKSAITLNLLTKEMKNHNALLNNAYDKADNE